MPIIKSAIKRMHQTATRRARNVTLKQDIKDATKAFRAKPSSVGLSKAQSQLDIAVKKNLLKAGTAARRKAQLAREAKAAGVKLIASAKKKPAASKAAVKKPVVKKKPAAKAASTKPPTKKTAPKKSSTKAKK